MEVIASKNKGTNDKGEGFSESEGQVGVLATMHKQPKSTWRGLAQMGFLMGLPRSAYLPHQEIEPKGPGRKCKSLCQLCMAFHHRQEYNPNVMPKQTQEDPYVPGSIRPGAPIRRLPRCLKGNESKRKARGTNPEITLAEAVTQPRLP